MSPNTIRSSVHINYPMIITIIGTLLLIEGFFMIIPTITAAVYRETDVMAFLISLVITLACGSIITVSIRPRYRTLSKRDGILLTSLTWVVFSVFGMMPFLLCASPLSLTDAFFETMSGFTTTGATVYDDVEKVSHSINMWRCLSQWIGGLGIVLFTLALLPMFNHDGGMQMFNAEMTGVTHEKLRPRVNQTAKILWAIYGALTIILTALLWIVSGSFFHSICHAFTTMATGGFSTTNGSNIFVDTAYGKLILTIFMFVSGVNFALIYRAMAERSLRHVFKDETLRYYCKIVVIGTVIFMVAALVNSGFPNWYSAIIDPLFQMVSTVTSTGFTVKGYESWGAIVPGVMVLAMLFGACAGSTTGGAKLDRLLFLTKNCGNELYRTVHPNSIRSVRINGTVMSREVVNRVFVFLSLYAIVIAIGAVMLSLLGVPVGEAFFDTYSCMTNNTGLNLNFAGIEGHGYTDLPYMAKWILAVIMLIGRLELFSVLVLFTVAFWHK